MTDQPDRCERCRCGDCAVTESAVNIPTPNGCRHCGIPERQHARQWTDEAGWHEWVAPSSAQILARMKARRQRPA